MSTVPLGGQVVPDPGRPGSFLVQVGGADQSHVDVQDPTHLEFPYVRRMGDVLDALPPMTQDRRRRVVHVGGAGMTLARYVSATRPGTAQVVLEPDTALTAQVREHLPLPRGSGIKVRPVDGRSGIAALGDGSADVVVVDAFVGAQVPAELVTLAFLADVHRALRPDGLLLMNVGDRAPFVWTGRLLAGIERVFAEAVVAAEPATLKGRRPGNLLVVAGSTSVPWRTVSAHAARQPFGYRVVPPDGLRSRFGAPPPFTDEDTEPSPAPPSGATFFA